MLSRITESDGGHDVSEKKASTWQNMIYVSIVLSAVIPIIVSWLIENKVFPLLASVLDAVFPALVGVFQRILASWSKKRLIYSQVRMGYRRLAGEVISDIYLKKLTTDSEVRYREKWDALDKILAKIGE